MSKFADEHPGGDEVLFSEVGKDATEAFEDVGHSDDARNLLPDMLVGTVEGAVSSEGDYQHMKGCSHHLDPLTGPKDQASRCFSESIGPEERKVSHQGNFELFIV